MLAWANLNYIRLTCFSFRSEIDEALWCTGVTPDLMWTGGMSLEGLAPINQLFQFKSAPPQIFLTGLILVRLSLFASVCCSLTSRETNPSMLRIVVFFYVIKLLYFLTSWSRFGSFPPVNEWMFMIKQDTKPSLTTCCVRLHRMKPNQHNGHVGGWKIFNSVSAP